MTSKNNHSLYQHALQHKVAPRESAWLKLDTKLEKSRNRKSLSMYRLVSIAAVLVAILSVITVFSTSSDKSIHISGQNTSLAQVYAIEELVTTDDSGIYEINKLRALNSAYTRISAKRQL